MDRSSADIKGSNAYRPGKGYTLTERDLKDYLTGRCCYSNSIWGSMLLSQSLYYFLQENRLSGTFATTIQHSLQEIADYRDIPAPPV